MFSDFESKFLNQALDNELQLKPIFIFFSFRIKHSFESGLYYQLRHKMMQVAIDQIVNNDLFTSVQDLIDRFATVESKRLEYFQDLLIYLFAFYSALFLVFAFHVCLKLVIVYFYIIILLAKLTELRQSCDRTL